MKTITIIALVISALSTLAMFWQGNINAFWGWGNAAGWALIHLITQNWKDTKEK